MSLRCGGLGEPKMEKGATKKKVKIVKYILYLKYFREKNGHFLVGFG